jgi:hypothetical protein
MDLDLNLQNYDLNDLLNLFQLPELFNEQDLKRAKQRVFAVHPDKSKLPSEYFLFFSKAYNLLYQVYIFKSKNDKTDTRSCAKQSYRPELDLIDKEDEERLTQQMKSLQESSDFSKIFHQLFEENKLRDGIQDSGYENWLRNGDSSSKDLPEVRTMGDMGAAFDIERKRQREKAIQSYQGVQDLNSVSTNQYDLNRGDAPATYSADVFSKLPYEDLRKAHEESIIPISEEDRRQDFNNVSSLMQFRTQQTIGLDLDKANHTEILQNQLRNDERNSTARGYYLAREMEEAKQSNKNFLSKFNYLKN